ncbi:MAG: VOC family protein [Deltaproteobacteria bacterium]|nr:VOC family protein [Deltaproteobacteria bacterium]
MIDHIGIQVTDLDKSIAFYAKALAPLGYTVLMKHPGFAGLGIGQKPDVWLGTPDTMGGSKTISRVHVAIVAKGRAIVREFYEAAIAAGGKDNGAPGLRPQYHEHYYGAFVLDPDGHNVEAVCHEAYLG